MNKNKLLLGGLFLYSLIAFGQEVPQDTMLTQKLDEVVVSDSRFKLKRENSGKTVLKITASELENSQGQSVAELINVKSGIEVNGSRSFSGQNTSVYARGGNNRQVLVIIDGIQVSDPSDVSAAYDLRLLSIAQIDTIEIIKGASSTLYGNSAATAVINITTKSATIEGVSLEVGSSIGTNQSQSEQNYDLSDFSNDFALSAKNKNLSVLVSGGHQFTNGLSAAIGTEKDAFSRIDGTMKVAYKFSKKFDISTSFFYHKIKSDFDNGFPVEDANFTFQSEQSYFSLSSVYNYKNGSLHLNGAFNKITRSFETNFPLAYNSASTIFDMFNKYTFNKEMYTIIGVNLIENETLFSEQQKTTTVDPYVNAVYISDFGFTINTGFRLNTHTSYGSHLIYNFNPSYRLKTKSGYIKFLSSYATSFIAPNLSQLFGPFGANQNLQPEENSTFEGGIVYKASEKFELSALYFNRREDNRIQYTAIDSVTSQYQNLNTKAIFNGLEVGLKAQPTKKIAIIANYTFTNAEEGLSLRVPKNSARGSFTYTLNTKTNMALNYQYVSERSDIDFNTFLTETLEAYGLLDFYIKHDFNKKLSMFFSINNILNKQYFEIIDYTTRGRNIRFGFRLKL